MGALLFPGRGSKDGNCAVILVGGLSLGEKVEPSPGESCRRCNYGPFDPWSVLLRTGSGDIGDDSGVLGVVQQADRQPRVHHVGWVTTGFRLSGIRTSNSRRKRPHLLAWAINAANVCE